MKRSLSRRIGDLFHPEESGGAIRPNLQIHPVDRTLPSRVSFKAIFWAGMAVGIALMLGRLS